LTYQVNNRFQNVPFKCNLHRYTEGGGGGGDERDGGGARGGDADDASVSSVAGVSGSSGGLGLSNADLITDEVGGCTS
jgi:hypothetical protein